MGLNAFHKVLDNISANAKQMFEASGRRKGLVRI